MDVTCECSDCILHPTDSHGLHLIGRYHPPAHLSRRRGILTSERVVYEITKIKGVHAPILPNASHVERIRLM